MYVRRLGYLFSSNKVGEMCPPISFAKKNTTKIIIISDGKNA